MRKNFHLRTELKGASTPFLSSPVSPFVSRFFLFLPLFTSPPSPVFVYSPPFPFLRRRTPKNPARGFGRESVVLCELYQRDPGRNTTRNRIWCILALKDENNKFNVFSKNKLTKLANLVQFKRKLLFSLERLYTH